MARVVAEGRLGPYGLRFDHAGLLVFPRTVEGALAELADNGFAVVRTLPSVVVRDRLARRHGLARPEVTIAHLAAAQGRTVELFLATGCPDGVAEEERAREHEAHLAFEASPESLGVLAALRQDGLWPDGGGFNPGEGEDGRSVFYFRKTGGERLEIVVAGHLEGELTGHLSIHDVRRRMLELLTGAWTTQALRSAVELGVADRLFEAPRTVAELAELTDCPADRLGRLLRYLAQLGAVTGRDGRVVLTPLGETLSRASQVSLAGLAELYGGLFYRSFGELPETVRTGTSGFELAFGAAPFDHFGANPVDAAAFQRGMADHSRDVFEVVADRLDLTGVTTVADLGGGEGALLGRILDAAPHVQGVLFDTPATVAAATPGLAVRFGRRVRAVGGDLFSSVPGADLLILSRVLHDWDDVACARILACCRAAVRKGTRLAVLERVLPDRECETSLATAWDLHMMVNNIAGRERTLGEYGRLLEEAGFEYRSQARMPLDLRMLEAVAV